MLGSAVGALEDRHRPCRLRESFEKRDQGLDAAVPDLGIRIEQEQHRFVTLGNAAAGSVGKTAVLGQGDDVDVGELGRKPLGAAVPGSRVHEIHPTEEGPAAVDQRGETAPNLVAAPPPNHHRLHLLIHNDVSSTRPPPAPLPAREHCGEWRATRAAHFSAPRSPPTIASPHERRRGRCGSGAARVR